MYKHILEFLLLPADAITSIPGRLVFVDVTEMFGVMMKVAMLSGLILASPLILLQIIFFVSPGLTTSEKRYLYLFLPGVLLSFFAGGAFAYYILIPPAINFLVNFGNNIAEPMIRISNYVNLVVMLIFWMGLVFETPVVMFILAKTKVVSSATFRSWRRYWIVVAFILGAFITPTFDPINQALVAIPLIALFEIGTILSRFAGKEGKPT